jgi:hypothetical protein
LLLFVPLSKETASHHTRTHAKGFLGVIETEIGSCVSEGENPPKDHTCGDKYRSPKQDSDDDQRKF